MNGQVEIIFATDGCVGRGISIFATFCITWIVLGPILFFLKSKFGTCWRTGASHNAADTKIDRAAIYSIVGLALIGIMAIALALAMAQTNTSLVASGDRIEVRGCVKARPFESKFDRETMSATYRMVRDKRTIHHKLVMEQKGQRTVKIGLGNHKIDSKLVLIAPDAMKLYAQKLRELGETVPPALQ